MRYLLPVAGLLALLVAAPGGRAEEAGTRSDSVHVALELRDGSFLTGRSADVPIVLHSAWGPIRARLSDVREIVFHDDLETATCSMTDGDVLNGVVEPAGVAVRCPDGTERRFDAPGIRRLRVWPEVSIAGSGGGWDLSFENAHGWTMTDEGGRLAVTGIEADRPTSAGIGPWSSVVLRHRIEPLADFDLFADLAWNSAGAGRRAMQRILVSLLDDDGNAIAVAGFRDDWVISTGGVYARLPGNLDPCGAGADAEPADGKARIGITRVGSHLAATFRGRRILTGIGSSRVTIVEVRFSFYDYHGPQGPSAPGTMCLERLELRRAGPGTPDPVGRWRHAVDGRPPGIVDLRPDGRMGDGAGPERWRVEDGVLLLFWPRGDAPGGVWVDRLRLSPDGRRYEGANQIGSSIAGQRLAAGED